MPADRHDGGGNPVPVAVVAETAVFGGDFLPSRREFLADVGPGEGGEEAPAVFGVDQRLGHGMDVGMGIAVHADQVRFVGVDEVRRVRVDVDFVDFGIGVAEREVEAFLFAGAFLLQPLLIRNVAEDEEGGGVLALDEEEDAVLQPQVFAGDQHAVLVRDFAAVAAAGLFQRLGGHGARDAFDVVRVEDGHGLGVKVPEVALPRLKAEVGGRNAAGEAPRMHVDLDDAVPGLAEHGALPPFEAGRRLFHALAGVDVLPEDEQLARVPRQGQQERGHPAVRAVLGAEAVFEFEPGVFRQPAPDVVRAVVGEEGFPVFGMDAGFGDGERVLPEAETEPGREEPGVLAVDDAHGVGVERNFVDFGVAALQHLVEVGFLVPQIGDVAQEEQGLILTAGQGADGRGDPAVGAVGGEALAVFDLGGFASGEALEEAAAIEVGHVPERVGVYAVHGAVADEDVEVRGPRRLDDLRRVGEQRRDGAPGDVEAEDFGVVVLKGEQVVVLPFLAFGDVADERDGLAVASGQGDDEGEHPVVGAVEGELAVFGGQFAAALQPFEQVFGPEEGEEGGPVPWVDAALHDRADVLVVASRDVDGPEEADVAEQAGEPVGVERDAVDLGVAVLEGDAEVFLLLPPDVLDALLVVDVADALEDAAFASARPVGDGEAPPPVGAVPAIEGVFQMPFLRARGEEIAQARQAEGFAEVLAVAREHALHRRLELAGVVARERSVGLGFPGDVRVLPGFDVDIEHMVIAGAEGLHQRGAAFPLAAFAVGGGVLGQHHDVRGVAVFPQDLGNRNVDQPLEGRVRVPGGEARLLPVGGHGAEGADVVPAPEHVEAGHADAGVRVGVGDRAVEVDDAVVAVDDVDRRAGQAVQNGARGFGAFAQERGGAALPDILPDDPGHEDERVHFLLGPDAPPAAFLEADVAHGAALAPDVAVGQGGDGRVVQEGLFLRRNPGEVAAIVDAAGVRGLGEAQLLRRDVLEAFLLAPLGVCAPLVAHADGLAVEGVLEDDDLVHAQGVADEFQRLVHAFPDVAHAEQDVDDVHHDAVADGVQGEGGGGLPGFAVAVLPEEFVAVLAVALGAVEGHVGLPEQVVVGDGVVGHGDADADGNGVVEPAVHEQAADGGAELLRAFADARRFAHVAHVDVEFVPAHAAYDVALPEGPPELAGDFDEDGVPRQMAHVVVDVLEIVDVDHEQHAEAAGPGVAQGDADFLFGGDLVEEAGHGVGAALVEEAELFALLAVDVAQRAHGLHRVAEPVAQGGAEQGVPALAPGGGGEEAFGDVADAVLGRHRQEGRAEPGSHGIDDLAREQAFEEAGDDRIAPEGVAVFGAVDDGVRAVVVLEGDVFGHVRDEVVLALLKGGAAADFLDPVLIDEDGEVEGRAVAGDVPHAGGGEVDEELSVRAEERAVPFEGPGRAGQQVREAGGGRRFEQGGQRGRPLSGVARERDEVPVGGEDRQLAVGDDGGGAGESVRIVEKCLQPVHSLRLFEEDERSGESARRAGNRSRPSYCGMSEKEKSPPWRRAGGKRRANGGGRGCRAVVVRRGRRGPRRGAGRRGIGGCFFGM